PFFGANRGKDRVAKLWRRRDGWELTDRLTDPPIRCFDLAALDAGSQMLSQCGKLSLRPVVATVGAKQLASLLAGHLPATSCWYRVMKRSRARIRRIFTAEGLTLRISAISAHENPSCS